MPVATYVRPMNGYVSSIDYRAELNDEQYAAVTAARGPALVLAGAGSGKTRTLTYRVAWLRDQGIQHWQFMLLTFTNKAAREMIDRVGKLTGEEKPASWGGTFHSIGARVLRRDGRAVGLNPGFTIMDQGDAESLFSEVAKSMNSSFFKDKEHPKPKVLQSWLSYARNTCRSLSDVVEERYPDGSHITEALIGFAEAYRKKKLASQVVDYDDLQTLWLEVLQKDPEALGRYQRQFEHILVDEYQDTNSIQSQIVDLIASQHQIMAVGDDAQCIYTWRGAEFDNILHFPERHPGTKIFQILSNYRSTQPILDFANDVLRMQAIVGSGYEKELRAVRKGSLKPRVVPCADTVAQARFVIARVKGLIDEGIPEDKIAVLYRAHYQALDLQLELSRNRMQFTITSGVRFFEQAHIRDIVAQLRLIVNPDDEPAFVRICQLLPKIGPKTASRLHQKIKEVFATLRDDIEKHRANNNSELNLFEQATEVDHTVTSEDIKEVAHPIDVLLDAKVLEKVPEAAREAWRDFALTIQEALEMQRSAPDDPGRVVQILAEGWYGDFLRVIHDNPDSRRDDLGAMIDFAGKYEAMDLMLAELVLLSSEANEKGLDDFKGKLRLSTIHQAKGLEFPVVFLIGASDGSLPLQRAIDDDNVDEERRLFYVAVTRAEDELYVCFPMLQLQRGGGIFRLERSRFIDEIEAGKFESAKPRRSWE